MIADSRPWQPAKDRFDSVVLPKLRRIGKQIGAAAQSGDVRAEKVISVYSTLHKSFDPMTLVFLEEALAEYEKGKSLTSVPETVGSAT